MPSKPVAKFRDVNTELGQLFRPGAALKGQLVFNYIYTLGPIFRSAEHPQFQLNIAGSCCC